MAIALSPVALPLMISTSIIFSTGEKKWMPMNSSGRREDFARPEIGRVDVFEAKMQSGRMTASTFAIDFGLDLRILEHRLDDEIAILQIGITPPKA